MNLPTSLLRSPVFANVIVVNPFSSFVTEHESGGSIIVGCFTILQGPFLQNEENPHKKAVKPLSARCMFPKKVNFLKIQQNTSTLP
jgi:hypothetical protein